MRLRVPLHDLWWLVSRAAGVTALLLVTAAVLLGLAMATRTLRRPALRRVAMRLHEDIAVVSLVALAVHGLALLGDAWLKPGLAGITIPFAISYRPIPTGIGILGGYLMLLLGPSFYLRRRLGAKRWRSLHRLTPAVWLMAAVHALTAGTDGTTQWLRLVVLAPLPALAYLLIVRLLSGSGRAAAGADRTAAAARPGGASAHGGHAEHSGRRPAGRRPVAARLDADGRPVSG